MQFNHWRDVCVPTFHLRPITCNQLPTTNPIAGGEEEEVLQCSTTTSFTSDVIPAVAPLLVITQDSSSSDDLSSGNKVTGEHSHRYLKYIFQMLLNREYCK